MNEAGGATQANQSTEKLCESGCSSAGQPAGGSHEYLIEKEAGRRGGGGGGSGGGVKDRRNTDQNGEKVNYRGKEEMK